MAKKKKRRKGNLRELLFANRKTIKELEAEGVSRRELKTAVKDVHGNGQLPKGEDNYNMAASLIAAALADNPEVQLPAAVNWDKIIELIEKLMPLIEAWISGCSI